MNGTTVADFLANNSRAPVTSTDSSEAKAATERSGLDWVLLLSDDQFSLAKTIQWPLRHCLVAVAIPLMVINMIVFSKKSMRNASGVYLIGLNLGQLAYVVSTELFAIWDHTTSQPFAHTWFCYYSLYITYYIGIFIGKRGSYAILCLATIERLYAVLRPLHVKTFILSKRPLLCMSTMYGFVAVWHLTFMVSVSIVLPSQGGQICRLLPNDLYFKHAAFFYGTGIAQKVVLTFLSLFIQLCLNVLITWALRRHNKANRQVKSSANEQEKKKQERQLTITLLGVSLSYVILSIPAGFFNVFGSTFPEFDRFGKYGKLYLVMLDFVYNATVLGCGVDFFCYMALSTKYRKTVFRLFGVKDKKASGSIVRTQTEMATISATN